MSVLWFRELSHVCNTGNEKCIAFITKFFSSNFHPLESVPRSRDPQLQVSGNYPGVSNWPFFSNLQLWYIFDIQKMFFGGEN